MSYKIVRMYKDSIHLNSVVKRGLTLEQAQAWCQDPETSSSTCTSETGKKRTEMYGPWFDGYEEEKPHYCDGAPFRDITNAFVRGQF